MASSPWLSGIAVLLGGGGALTYAHRTRPSSARDFPSSGLAGRPAASRCVRVAPWVDEVRMGVRGGSMVGMGRTSTPRGLEEYELTLIAERQGELVYEAHPSGQPAAVFKANVATADSV